MTVYMLKAFHLHTYAGETETEDFLLGFFDSVETCDAMQLKYRQLPGFSLPEVRFVRTPWECANGKTGALTCVYYVAHSFMDADGWEDNDEIGVYASMEEAEKEKAAYIADGRVKRPRLNGKAKKPYLLDRTDVIPYELNKPFWTEGFTFD